MRGIVMIGGQTYVQLLDEINIKDPEAIRRVIRQAVMLPPIDEVTRQGIKICVSGPVSSLLGTSTSNLTWVEQKAANDIQKLWKRGERYQIHIKRLIQDCDVTKADFMIVKGVESARKYCLQTQEAERRNEEDRSFVQSETNDRQGLPDEEDDQELPQTPKDTYEKEKRVSIGHLREGTTPNTKQKRNQRVAEQSSTRSISVEIQDFENQGNWNEFTSIDKLKTHDINNSKKQADMPKNAPGTRMVNSLRDHNVVGVKESKNKTQTQKIRQTRNSLKRSENNGVASNEIVLPPEFSGSQNVSNALTKELADYNERGGKEESVTIGERREHRHGGHGGARCGPAWEKLKTERGNDARSPNHKSQDDQPGSENNPIGIEDGSDNETVVHGKLDNQEEDVEMEDLQ
ncbi:hypothetical protein BHYA_0428g00040 [Botrytis hyacinthi]|uniref:Uncharacterized protein n=1 Tax=Botrytis hyacinthi TaxID=278943 RepID=A0A4Z1G3X0_9HELO|nr:hypothetical protein BHYA_0428g00040 [Botrytis hyacinthi]